MARNQTGANSPSWKGGEHTYICEVCGEEFKRRPCYVARSRRNGFKYLTCSKGCSNRIYKKHATGDKNPAWKGGITVTLKICPNCKREFRSRPTKIYCSNSCYYIALGWGKQTNTGKRNFRKYRQIAESIAGRELLPHEVVHHIDGDHTNNHPDNLMILTATEHTRLHVVERTNVRKQKEKQTT